MGLRRAYIERYLTKTIPENGWVSFSSSPEIKFHVCTIASRKKRHLEKLILSCKRSKLDLKIIGMGNPYPGNHIKLPWVLDHLNSRDDDEIVMFVDGYDVLVIADQDTILEKFKKMNAPLVIAAERGCYPYPYLAEQYPESPTPFRYINSGSYIGYVGYIRKWIEEIEKHREGSDQGLITIDYLKEPRKNYLTLDYNCELFLPLYKVAREELEIDAKSKSVFCKTTGSYPCVMHANAGPAGGAYTVWNEIYKKLIKRFLLN